MHCALSLLAGSIAVCSQVLGEWLPKSSKQENTHARVHGGSKFRFCSGKRPMSTRAPSSLNVLSLIHTPILRT